MKQPLAIAALVLLASPLAALDRPVQVIQGSFAARMSGFCRSITDKDVTSGLSGDFRVRRGASLTASGNRHVIYVDSGATVHVTGQSSTIFVARGGEATIGGEKNQVFMESGSKVQVRGHASLAMVGELDLKLNRNAEECR
jgi:hypothetical protein